MKSSDKISLFSSIKFILLSWFLIFAIIPLSVISYVWYDHTTDSMQKMSIRELKATSEMQEDFIGNWFKYREVDLITWSQSKSTVNFLKELQREKELYTKSLEEFVKSFAYVNLVSKNSNDLEILNREYDYLYDIFLINLEGDILFTLANENDFGTNLNSGIYSDTKFAQAYRKTLKSGKIYFSDIERYEASDNNIASFLTAPLIDNSGHIIGVFAVQIKLDYILEHFKSSGSFRSYLVGTDGYLRTPITSDDEILNVKVKTQQFESFKHEHIDKNSKHEEDVSKYKNIYSVDVIGLHHEIDILGVKWAIFSEVEEKYTLASSQDLAQKVFQFLLFVILFVIIIALYNTYKIVKPIERLRKASKAFSLGKRDVVIVGEGKGEIGALTDSFNDMIDSLNKNEKELIKQTTQAQEALKSKSEFLANMSHEIRTPMNGVLGMLGLLMNSKLTDSQHHQVYLAQSSANALLSLINDILDFSKVEAGKLEIEALDFNLRNELGNFIEAISFKAQEKGVEIILDTIDVEHLIVKSDPNRLRQILTNLVSNAIKFTKDGHVLIKAILKPQDDENARLIIKVIDTGIGIPEDKLEALFESFTQVDASTTRKYGGTGLGLAIVEKLCNLMDGHVEVTSKVGEGSTFTIDIAVGLTPESTIVMPNVDINGKRALIVDDNEVNREVLRGQLARWGMVLEEAQDGEEALEILDDAYNKKIIPPFDIAILDMQMPNMDGEELGNIIRSNNAYDDIKLVMMTSLGFRGDAKRYANIGFNAFFPKPTTTNDLYHALNVLVEDSEAFQNATPLVTSDYLSTLVEEEDIIWPTNIRILLVEDNYTNQVVANGILNSLGLNAVAANNGLEALSMLKKATDKSQPFDLVIMDCQMPEMDGYEATELIRSSEAGESNSGVPIIAMTANAMDGDREKCIAVGMNDYISKPINPTILKQTLVKWILGDTIDEEVLDLSDEPENEFVIWDKKEALARFSGSQDILRKIINIFLDDVAIQLENLKDAFDKNDFNDIKLYAHTIKGAAGNLSAHKLESLAKKVETDAKEEKIIISVESLYEELSECLKETTSQLKTHLEEDFQRDDASEVSTTELINSLKTLQVDITNGEFIDSSSLEIFNIQTSPEISEKLKKLNKEVDNFESDEAIITIEYILKSLVKGQ